MHEIRVGDCVIITIKRPDYYGLQGQVIEYPSMPYSYHLNRSVPFGEIIKWYPVQLDLTDNLPTRLIQMGTIPYLYRDVYLFTRSQFEVEPWNSHAVEILGEDYFA